MPTQAGRPKRVSREILQEAGFELFQLRGYRKTSVEAIARMAGFSRATFFNVYASKAELFWVETDTRIEELTRYLDDQVRQVDAPALTTALLGYVSRIDSSSIPWALQNASVIQAADDLIASGASRVLAICGHFERYERSRAEKGDGMDAAQARYVAAAVTAVFLESVRAWVDAGVARLSLETYLAKGFRVSGLRADG